MTKQRATAQSRNSNDGTSRLDLRSGLNLAFVGVASLTMVASVVAFLSYSHIGASLARLEDDSVPALTNALGVARETAELSAIASRVIAAQNEQQLDATRVALEPERAAMEASLEALAATSIGSTATAALSKGSQTCSAARAISPPRSARDCGRESYARLSSRMPRPSIGP
jgi:phosphoglycerate-specific signal transduction histidine kinase